MSEFVSNCPRCGAKNITFDLKSQHQTGTEAGWKRNLEAFCVCRHCGRSTVFKLSQRERNHDSFFSPKGLNAYPGGVNQFVDDEGFVSLKDLVSVSPPEHLPAEIEAAFREGATCLSVNCYNAAATMFRLCIDLSTRSMLPKQDDPASPNSKIRRNLGLRLPWLLDNNLLPEALRDLSSSVKEDGNDGAHAGTLGKQDAEDLLDFTIMLLERIYTEPERLKRARDRRESRRREQ